MNNLSWETTLFQEIQELARNLTDTVHPSQNIGIKYLMDGFKQGKIKLPLMPAILSKVRKIIANPDSSIIELESIIGKDQVLTGKILNCANSVFYQGIREVVSLKAAIARIGMLNVQNIVSAVEIKNVIPFMNPTFNSLAKKLWHHSIACSLVARKLAKRWRTLNHDTVFFAGLFHDIGKLFILKAIFEMNESGVYDLEFKEPAIREVFNLTHVKFGVVILEKWDIHTDIIDAVATHHEETTNPVVNIIQFGNLVSKKLGIGIDHHRETDFSEEPLMTYLGLNYNELDDFLENVRGEINTILDAF